MTEPYQDIEKQLAAWALTIPGVVGSGNRTDATLEQRLVYVRWIKTGGTENRITDYPVVDCDVFAASRDQARQIAEHIVAELAPRTHLTPGGAIIDYVKVSPTPRQLPWSNSKVSRYGATFALGLRR